VVGGTGEEVDMKEMKSGMEVMGTSAIDGAETVDSKNVVLRDMEEWNTTAAYSRASELVKM